MRTLYEDPRFVFGLVGAWFLFHLLLTLLNERYKRAIRTDLDGMTDTERAAYWETITQHDPQQAGEIRELVRDWTDWPWRIRDSVVGFVLVFGPVVALFWFTGRWSLKSNMVWQDMAAILAGFGVYWMLHSRMLRAYGCPKCQAKLTRQAGKDVRFPCHNCQRVWLLGDY